MLLQTVDTAAGGEYRSRTAEFAGERGEKGAMKILVIGSGGREHALVWKLGESKRVEKIWCAPGNGGIAQEAECVALDAGDVNAIVALAERLKPDLTVVGPEAPLVAGVADEFSTRAWAIAGPAKQGAQLEGSKVFAKEFLKHVRGLRFAGGRL